MEIVPQKIMDYVEQHSADEPTILAELRRETWQKIINPRMLSGPLQGRVLSMISKLVKPKIILEIGTYTGYATICLSEGLNEEGVIYTIDINEELKDIQEKFFKKSKYYKNIKPLLGSALDIIPQLDCKFDLIFIDANKNQYCDYYDLVIEKMNIGGIIITDNVLWSGKVVEKTDYKDTDTISIMTYNKKLKDDKRVETVILPFRDGLSITRKI